MVYLSDQALGTDTFPEESGIFRRITHDPIGVVYVIVSVIIIDVRRWTQSLIVVGAMELSSINGNEFDYSSYPCWYVDIRYGKYVQNAVHHNRKYDHFKAFTENTLMWGPIRLDAWGGRISESYYPTCLHWSRCCGWYYYPPRNCIRNFYWFSRGVRLETVKITWTEAVTIA